MCMCLIVQVTGSQWWSLDLLYVCRLNLSHREAVCICCCVLCTLECGLIKEAAAAGVHCTAVTSVVVKASVSPKLQVSVMLARCELCCVVLHADSLVLYVFVLYFPGVLSLHNSIIKKTLYKWVTNADVRSESTRQNLVTIVTIPLIILTLIII